MKTVLLKEKKGDNVFELFHLKALIQTTKTRLIVVDKIPNDDKQRWLGFVSSPMLEKGKLRALGPCRDDDNNEKD